MRCNKIININYRIIITRILRRRVCGVVQSKPRRSWRSRHEPEPMTTSHPPFLREERSFPPLHWSHHAVPFSSIPLFMFCLFMPAVNSSFISLFPDRRRRRRFFRAFRGLRPGGESFSLVRFDYYFVVASRRLESRFFSVAIKARIVKFKIYWNQYWFSCFIGEPRCECVSLCLFSTCGISSFVLLFVSSGD